MKAPAILVAAAVLVVGLGGIGLAEAMSPRPGSAGAMPTGDRHRCFDADNIRSFDSSGERKLVIVSDFNEAYELELGGACFGLDTALEIGVRSRMGSSQVCGPFDADIVYRDAVGIRGTERCPVTKVRHLTGEDAKPYVVARTKREG